MSCATLGRDVTHRSPIWTGSGNGSGPRSVFVLMTHTTIAVLVGSLRSDSVNRKLAELLAERAPEGVTVEIVDGLGEIPFYNEDIDNPRDIPAAAAALRDQVGRADRVLAVTPEYNGTMPAVLNNAIDWLSRPYGAGAMVGKPFGVVGATPTPYGGKLAHADAVRSARIAGAAVVEDVTVSQPAVDVDVLSDPDVLDRLTRAVRTLADHDASSVAA